MPFKSPRQRRYLYAKHPEIARRWSAEEKAVSKMDPRYGAGGGSHGSRIIEKSEDSKHRARRNAAIGAGVGTAVGHQAITGGLATRGVNNFLRSESPHLSKPARYAMSGAAGTAAAWHPSTLLSAARTPKYLALLAPGAIAGGVIGARKKKKVAKADKIGEIHRAAKARRSLGQAFGDEVLMPAAHKVMGPKYVKPGKGKLNAEERRQQGLWMAQGYPVNKADWMGIEEHKRRAAGSRRTRNRGYTVGGASLGAAAAMAGAMPGSVSELRDISRTARARVVPTRHGEETHEFRIKDGHMGMSPGMRARNVVRSAKVRPGGALVGGALGLTAVGAGVGAGAGANAKRHDRAIARQRKANARKAPVAKSRREYDPEHRRQRRLGIAEAALVGGGGTAAGFGGHGAYSDTKKLRRAKVFNGVGAKHSVLSQTPIGRGALSINRKNALLLGGGLLGLGAAGAVRAHAEKPKGRPWD